MTAFMLSCVLGTANVGSLYFQSINDCIYYSEKLSGQQVRTEEGAKRYDCYCKLKPYVNDKKVRVY